MCNDLFDGLKEEMDGFEGGDARVAGPREVHVLDPLSRKVDIRLPGKGNSNSHGARPVH